MSDSAPFKIALLGLGNLMRTDDAVGMLTLRTLAAGNLLPPEVRVIEGGTLGLDLLDSLRGISHLLVLDAVDTGAIPGTLKLGFSDLMGALRLIDAAPEEVVLLGVQPASTGWGTVLTSAVETAQQALMELTLEQLAQWTVDASAFAAAATESRDLEIVT